MLSIREVCYRYPGGVTALAGVDLELGAGELCALVGANGSGKTTLLQLARAALVPDSGRVLLFGGAPDSPRRLASRVAWIGQDTALDPTMTGTEHLHLQAALMGLRRGPAEARIAELVEGLRLEHAIARLVSSYSGGMRRRLHVVLGLLHDPELLLLDEPTAGLDPEGQAAIWLFLVARARAGRALLVVSHDLARVREHATKVVFLDEGKLAGSGTPAELCTAHGDLLVAYTALTGRDARELGGDRHARPDREQAPRRAARRAHG
jgi:ABC-2 type transport system ATP-binding protein